MKILKISRRHYQQNKRTMGWADTQWWSREDVRQNSGHCRFVQTPESIPPRARLLPTMGLGDEASVWATGNKCPLWWGDCSGKLCAGYMVHGKPLKLPLNFAVNLKLL